MFHDKKQMKMPIIVSSEEARKKFEENLKRLQVLESNLMPQIQETDKTNLWLK